MQCNSFCRSAFYIPIQYFISVDSIMFMIFRKRIRQISLGVSILVRLTGRRLSGEVENAHQKVVIDLTKPFPQPPSYGNGSRP